MFFKKRKYRNIINEARLFEEKRLLKEAKDKYIEAFQIMIDGNDYFHFACLYIDLCDFDKAINILDDILDNYSQLKDNDLNFVYFGLGLCYDSLKKKDLAIKNYELAIKYGCISAECYYYCANIYDEEESCFDDEMVEKIITYYKKTIELNPNFLYAYVNLACFYLKLDNYDEAIENYLKAKELDVENLTNCNFNIGLAYFYKKDYDNAIKYYKEDLKEKIPYPSTNYNLGVLYKDINEYALAKLSYQQAIKDNQKNYHAWYNLGCVYALEEDFDNAFSCFTYLKYNSYEELDMMKKDEDLVTLIKDKRYIELIK